MANEATIIPIGDLSLNADEEDPVSEAHNESQVDEDESDPSDDDTEGKAVPEESEFTFLSLRDAPPVLAMIISYLDAVTVVYLMQTTKALKHFCSEFDLIIWKDLSQARWGTDTLPKKLPKRLTSWKEYFRTRRAEISKNWKSGECTFSCLWGHEDKVVALAFDDRFLVTGSMDKNVKMWNLYSDRSCSYTFSGHEHFISAVRLSTRSIVTASADSTVKFWDIGMQTNTDTEYVGSQIYDMIIEKDNPKLVCVACADKTVRILDFRAPSVNAITLEGHAKEVLCLGWTGFSSGEWRVMSGSMDKTVKVWDWRSPKEVLKTMSRHKRAVTALCWDGGDLAFSASADNTARHWSLETCKAVRKFEGHTEPVTCMQANGNTLITGSNDRSIRIWNIKKGKCLHCFSGYSGDVYSLQFNRDMIINGSVRTVNIWDFSAADSCKS